MSLLTFAKQVFDSEIQALCTVRDRLSEEFDHAVRVMLSCKGRVIVCGMGKSGLVGKKIAASLSSTGTPSFFVHPAEAIHGDLGMICADDVFIGISYSGETSELVAILPYLKECKVPIISLTSNRVSTLGKASTVFIDVSVPAEACPLQLAPTSSSTAALVMGDALTVALMSARSFTVENFARFHPGGSLGRRLLSSVRQEMVVDNLPLVKPSSDFASVIGVITEGSLGLAIVIDSSKVIGIITDGDIRRHLRGAGDIKSAIARDLMTRNPLCVDVSISMTVALDMMEEKQINRLLVLDKAQLVGVLKK